MRLFVFKNIAEIIRICKAAHFPEPETAIDAISSFEAGIGYTLPDDMRTFYLACNGASLFRPRKEFPPFRIMPLSEIVRARVAIYGEDKDEYGSSSHYVFCDRGDGDYVGIDLAPRSDGTFGVLDIWHEAYPEDEYSEPIAFSFTEFMSRALDSGGNSVFWL